MTMSTNPESNHFHFVISTAFVVCDATPRVSLHLRASCFLAGLNQASNESTFILDARETSRILKWIGLAD